MRSYSHHKPVSTTHVRAFDTTASTASGARTTSVMARLWARLSTSRRRRSATPSLARRPYLFIGKSGAILLGFPDTTQDADLFVEKSETNGLAIVAALRELGFGLADQEAREIESERTSFSSRTARSTST
jgi:hypothetical protein